MNEIVARIYKIISDYGLSKSEFAKRIGVSKNTIQYWKNENAYPSLAVIGKICEVTGITAEQFFYGMGRKGGLNAEEKFLDSWRLLNEEEKSAILQTMKAFKKDKAVKND